jgi:rRNA biogenesis protein RRP5
VQVLGLFNGTIHPLHISAEVSKLQVGKKVQARILWDILETEPRQFALSTLKHVISLEPRNLREFATPKVTNEDRNGGIEDGHLNDVEQAYPVGTILDNIKVSRVDSDRGLFLDIARGLQAVVHVSTSTAPEHA